MFRMADLKFGKDISQHYIFVSFFVKSNMAYTGAILSAGPGRVDRTGKAAVAHFKKLFSRI